MVNYKINDNTLAIFSTIDNKSHVYEGKIDFEVEANPNNIIKFNCRRNGSSLPLRLKKTTILTGDTYKSPILLNNVTNLIFFPTSSLRSKNVSWVNLNNVDTAFYDSNNKRTVIKFLNGKNLEFDVSLNIIKNQIFRAMRLEHKLVQIKAIN